MQLRTPNFQQGQVWIVGDVMLDRYWHGDTLRISPEAAVPVVDIKQQEERLGGAANVALNVAALGAAVSLHACVGKDDAAQMLNQRLQAVGIEAHLLETAAPTITKLRVISRNQQLLRMDFECKVAEQDAAELLATMMRTIPAQAVLVLSDYNKGVLQAPQQLIKSCRERGIRILVDPKGVDFTKYAGANLLTPNIDEFEAVVGRCASEDILYLKAQTLIKQLALEALLITRGEQGMSLVRPNQPPLHLPAKAREVYDVTGAGDTVIATLAAAIASGEDLGQAVALANLAASVVVGKLGTVSISLPELRAIVQQEGGVGRGVMSLDQLRLAMDDARAQGEKIVMTNGCFDIIHAGHVGYLEQARKYGQRLMVAVNSDASVKRLKGSGRPINTLERRMAVLAGLQAVDWVIGFEDDTPCDLIRMLQPDVLVKGGDYAKQQVVGWEIVESYGGEVRVLGLWENLSTTAIVEKISGKAK